MFLVRWAEALLRDYGYRIDPPGTPDPRDPATAAAMLRAGEWTVTAPGIEPPTRNMTSTEMLGALTAVGFQFLGPGELPPFDRDGVIERLKREGYGVVRPLQPPPVGSVWAPHPDPDRKGKKALPAHALLPRTVIAADGLHVIYERGGERHPPITLDAWYRWLHDMRATVQEMAS